MMASRKRRSRATREGAGARRPAPVPDAAQSAMVPGILLGAVNGAEIVAANLLRFSLNVLVSTVAGAADVGAAAISATAAGVRGMVSAASRMVGDIATTAQTSFQEAAATARQSSVRAARSGSRRPL